MTAAARTTFVALAVGLNCGLASCQSRSYAIVTVEASAGIPAIVQLRVHAADGLSQGVAVIPGAPVTAGSLAAADLSMLPLLVMAVCSTGRAPPCSHRFWPPVAAWD